MRAQPLAPVLASLLLVLPGCQMNERMSGTIFGGAGGALVGGLAAESLAGALIGGAGGALAGYLIGDYLADQRERGRTSVLSQAPQQAWAEPAVAAVKMRHDAGPGREAYARGRRARTAGEARAAYEEAVRQDPGHADAWNALGLNLLLAGEAAPAERAFQQALAADPGHYAAAQNLRWVREGVR